MRDPFEDPPEPEHPCSCGRCEWTDPPGARGFHDERELDWSRVRCRECDTGPWVASVVRRSYPVARKPHPADDGSGIRPGERYISRVVRGYYPGGRWTLDVSRRRLAEVTSPAPPG